MNILIFEDRKGQTQLIQRSFKKIVVISLCVMKMPLMVKSL